jgi:CRISPR system Cascade subunit CasA
MTFSFNLIEDPFIPCVRHDGLAVEYVEYGLRDVLLKAHEIAEVRDGSPLVTVALHRLLLAILHRCYQGPKNSVDRVAIRKLGRFDTERITEYFVKWAEQFDLFHEKYPFFQRPGFLTKEPSGINRLAQELSRGNNAALFDHTADDAPPALTAAEAARVVIAEQAFAVGGGKSDTGNTTHAPLVSGAVVLVRGTTLFETLWLNLTLYDGDEKPVPCDGDDVPLWEQSQAQAHKEPAVPHGYLDYLTWQSRTLRLHPEQVDGQLIVRRVSYAQGRKLNPQTGFYDPMMGYRRDPKQGDRVIRLTENRDLWRDSAALFQFAEADQFKGPTTLHTLQSLPDEVLSRAARYRVSAFGLCMDSRKAAKVNFWRHESLPLSPAYLDRPELVESLKQALRLAEQVARILIAATYEAVIQIKKDLSPTNPEDATRALEFTNGNDRSPKRRPDPIGNRVKSLSPDRDYWAQLEARFRVFLEKLALARDVDEQKRQVGVWFHQSLATLVERAYAVVSRTLAKSQRDLHGVAVGERYLLRRLRRLGKKYPVLEESQTEVSHA